jgi:uncharacterized damage-inducible protein DinB
MANEADSEVASAAVAPLAFIFDTNDALIRRTLKDLPPEAGWQQPGDGGNSIMWILGHITQTRAGLLAILGEPVETGWGNLFKRGAERQDPRVYPRPDAIKQMGAELTARLRDTLRTIGDDQLATPVTQVKVAGVTNLAQALAFFAFHEAYHVGQLGYVRKLLGHGSIAG